MDTTAGFLRRITGVPGPAAPARLHGAIRARPRLATTTTVMLVLVARGCRTAPPPLRDEVRTSLGTVGVYSVGPTADPSLKAAVGVGNQVAVGAAKGGGYGLASGAAGGAVASLFCGPFAPICAIYTVPIGMVSGIVAGSLIGGRVGGAKAVPSATGQTIVTALSAVTANRDLAGEMRRHVLEGTSDGTAVDLGDGAGTDESGYRRFAARGVDAVLEVRIARLGLFGKAGRDPYLTLRIDANTRLVSAADGHELWSYERIGYVSRKARASEWLANDSRLLADRLDEGLRTVARKIDDGTAQAGILHPRNVACRTTAGSAC